MTTFIDLTSTDRLDVVIGAPTQDQITEAAAVAELIVDQHLPRWRQILLPPRPRWRWTQLREACVRIRALLARGPEVKEHLGSRAPTLSVDSFHPWA